ncbi:methyl-accepting chemotaxis protein [Streptomyces sp. NPDC046909]|uniref:methyl-accepting chemotaxis protein n=1 Tax=Streptomyces sp. NPDC046909 TaxID=3155617 RepID=UPI00340F5DA0
MPAGSLMDRHVVAQSIKDLAERPALETRRQELTALADALGSQDTGALEPWTELDLLAAYARPESVHAATGRPAEPRVWSYAEAVLGALVFVPLTITWYGLTRASSAYGALTGADPKAASRPFLQLWQSGFEGHLTGLFTFGHVAMSATVAILVLLTLVLVHGLRRSAVARREEAAEQGAQELMALLVPALTRAQLLLHQQRLASPQRFAAELTAAATTLNKLGNKALRVQKDLSTAATVVGDAVESAERRLAGVDASVRPLETAAGRIEAAVGDGAVQVRKALDDVRDASGEVRAAVADAGERVEESVTVLAASQRAYTTGIEVTSDVSGQLLDRLGDIAEGTAHAVEESRRTVDELGSQTAALRTAAERFAELANELRADRADRADWSNRSDHADRSARTANGGDPENPHDGDTPVPAVAVESAGHAVEVRPR